MPSSPVEACPVLHVSDLTAALEFYKTVLGCEQQFVYDDFYAGLCLAKVSFHISQGSGPFNRPVGGANLYFILSTPAEVDACYAEIVAKGGRVSNEPHNYPYGMRDFVVFDPDGNMLSFGASTEG